MNLKSLKNFELKFRNRFLGQYLNSLWITFFTLATFLLAMATSIMQAISNRDFESQRVVLYVQTVITGINVLSLILLCFQIRFDLNNRKYAWILSGLLIALFLAMTIMQSVWLDYLFRYLEEYYANFTSYEAFIFINFFFAALCFFGINYFYKLTNKLHV